jgi:hypothetical protein
MEIGLKRHTSVPCTIVHTIARILHTEHAEVLGWFFYEIYFICTTPWICTQPTEKNKALLPLGYICFVPMEKGIMSPVQRVLNVYRCQAFLAVI